MFSIFLGEVTELVPVPDFKSVVPQYVLGKVGSIPMLSRHHKKNPHGFPVRVFSCVLITAYFL